MTYTLKCQFCGSKEAGLIRWPTAEDDYACASCIRGKYTAMMKDRDAAVRAIGKVCARHCNVMLGEICAVSHCPAYNHRPTAEEAPVSLMGGEMWEEPDTTEEGK